MNIKRIDLPAPVEPLAQDWKGISTELGPDGLVHAILIDLDIYEKETHVELKKNGYVRVIAHNRRGPHFDVGRSADGLRGFEGHKAWYRESLFGEILPIGAQSS